MCHQTEAFVGIDHDNQVGRVRFPLLGRCTRDQGTRMYHADSRCLQRCWIGTTAARAKTALKIPSRIALAAALIGNAIPIVGPVEWIHATLSSTSDTCEDSTPPSPCNNASVALPACRFWARFVSWRCASTRCAIAPPTPQWP